MPSIRNSNCLLASLHGSLLLPMAVDLQDSQFCHTGALMGTSRNCVCNLCVRSKLWVQKATYISFVRWSSSLLPKIYDAHFVFLKILYSEIKRKLSTIREDLLTKWSKHGNREKRKHHTMHIIKRTFSSLSWYTPIMLMYAYTFEIANLFRWCKEFKMLYTKQVHWYMSVIFTKGWPLGNNSLPLPPPSSW